MKVLNVPLGLVFAVVLLMSQSLLAVPTFQVAAPVSGTPGDSPPFEDTWLVTDSTFDIVVVGTYQAADSEGVGATASLTEGTLLVSVPDGQQGTISITDAGNNPLPLLKTPRSVADGFWNPPAPADTDVLTDVSGNDGYDTKDFLPAMELTLEEQIHFNNHYPFQEGVSDFLIYGLGSFGPEGLDFVHDYNADEDDDDYVPPGDPDFPLLTGNLGVEKTFTVTVGGFNWVHFDVYGYESYVDGVPSQLQPAWRISANSHDTTYIPAPGAMLLAGIGVGMVGWLRGRRTL